MRNTFLKSFSKTGTAKDLVEFVLQPDLDEIKDVTKGEFEDATKGEILVGKQIAAEMLRKLIEDIQYYKEEKIRIRDPRDKMN